MGMIFRCYPLLDLLASLALGKYQVHIGAKFMFVTGLFASGGITVLFGALDQVLRGPVFIAICFLMEITGSVSFAAAVTASSSVLTKTFPNMVAAVLGSLETFPGLRPMLGLPLGGPLCQSFAYAGPFIFLGYTVLPINMCILHIYGSDPGKHLKRMGASHTIKREEYSDG